MNQTTANRCVKLYGLSPLPFMLFFLLRATSGSADGAKAAAVARQVMAAGAAAGAAAGGVSAGTTTAAATAGNAAGNSAAAAGGLSAKLIAGILVGVLLVGGGAAAVVLATRNAKEPEPVVSEYEPEDGGDDASGFAEAEAETPSAEDELIPADRLAMLGEIAYYGDPAEYRMTVNQARAYAKVIETGSDAPYAALIDVGEGHPVLLLARGTDESEFIDPDHPDLRTGSIWFSGKLEVWQYIDGKAETVAAAHHVYWKEGEGGRNFIRLNDMSLIFDWAMGQYEAGWTAIKFGDYVSTGDADEDILDTQEFSPGPEAAAVLRQCAGD